MSDGLFDESTVTRRPKKRTKKQQALDAPAPARKAIPSSTDDAELRRAGLLFNLFGLSTKGK